MANTKRYGVELRPQTRKRETVSPPPAFRITMTGRHTFRHFVRGIMEDTNMRYTVTIMEHTAGGDDHARSTWHYFSGRTLAEAWRICDRHARRGVKRFGGTVRYDNWGSKGGVFPDAYRSATIRLDA